MIDPIPSELRARAALAGQFQKACKPRPLLNGYPAKIEEQHIVVVVCTMFVLHRSSSISECIYIKV